jgi:hypothetical protein
MREKGFPHKKKNEKKRNARRLWCLRHARFYFTTGEKSENDARDANERRRSCAFLLVARSQQQRLFDFVRVIISLNPLSSLCFLEEREGKTKKKRVARARLFFLNLKRLLFFTFAITREKSSTFRPIGHQRY